MKDRVTANPERLDGLLTVLDLVRSREVRTRPELARESGLGRAAVTQRVEQLMEWGLLQETGPTTSTGGRAPRGLRFNTLAGSLLVASLGVTSLHVALTDLSGRPLSQHDEACDIAHGPELILDRVEELFDGLRRDTPQAPPVWSIGIAVPGPVEFAAGRPIAPPIMPGWDGYPIKDRFIRRYGVPTWVDNDVNVMALGELWAGQAQGETDVVFVKVGTGIGAGLISGGRLHRGAQGVAGDVGHVAVVGDTNVICRCGNRGCIEANAGGYALAREATAAARDGRSPYLAAIATTTGHVDARDVGEGAQRGDPFCVDLIGHAGRLVGEMLAVIVNVFNPSLAIVGGGVSQSGEAFLAAIRQTVYGRSLALATRDLHIVRSTLGHDAGVIGAAALAATELFSPAELWSRFVGS